MFRYYDVRFFDISMSRLECQQQKRQCHSAGQEPNGILADIATLPGAQRLAGLVSTPSHEVECAIDNVAVEPGYGRRDTTEDDAMRDILPNLVLIETLIGCTVQLGERLIQAVGNGLALTLIDISSQTDAQNGNNRRGSSYLRVEVN